jgi:predicted HNH restriction endonuclease
LGKRLEYTPNSQIRSALRRLFLRSRERSFTLRRDKYTCKICKAKQSRAKGREVYVEVHHTDGVENWQELFAAVRKYLLVHPDKLQTLCEDCHKYMQTDVEDLP